MLQQFAYLTPASEKELTEILARHKDKARILAGGTNLLVDIRSKLIKPEYVVDVKKIPGVKDINFSEEKGLFIGASVTCNELLENKVVQEKYPLLVRGAEELASYQLRNRATVVGNICYASPAGDMAPVLLLLDAQVLIVSQRGEKTVPLKEFFKGVKKSVLGPEDFVKGITVPSKSAYMKGGFEKSKRVKGHDLSIVSVAMSKEKDTFRVAVGSCAPVPVLVEGLSSQDNLKTITDKTINSVCPIDDLRGSAEYRFHMVKVYIKRLYAQLQGGEN